MLQKFETNGSEHIEEQEVRQESYDGTPYPIRGKTECAQLEVARVLEAGRIARSSRLRTIIEMTRKFIRAQSAEGVILSGTLAKRA